jgi:hypothetical protein
MVTMRRTLPAIGLFFLAPLVAEFLLGNLPITSPTGLAAYLPAALFYGSGALLVREAARRAGYGWPTIIAFALAYGVIEEGFGTLTLFNPNYEGLSLLDYGYVPALGIAPPWTLFVLGLHTIWSISVPIFIVETLAGSRRTTPWLGRRGFAAIAGLFVLIFAISVAVGLIVPVQGDTFVPSAPQLIGTGIAVVALITVGVRLGRRGAATGARPETDASPAPSPLLVGVVALVAGAVFMLLYATDPTGLSPWLADLLPIPAWLATLIYLALYATMAVLVVAWSRRPGWSDAHRLGLAGGALLTYAWHSFPWQALTPDTSQTADLASNTILAAGAVALLVLAARRLQQQPAAATAVPAVR